MKNSSDLVAGMLGRLPKGEANGLGAIVHEMAKEPSKIRAAIILFDADRVANITDTGSREVRARVRRIEVVADPEDAAVLQRLLMRHFERRTGVATLPFELESDVNDAFAGMVDADGQLLAEAAEALNDPGEWGLSAPAPAVENAEFVAPEPAWSDQPTEATEVKSAADLDEAIEEPDPVFQICRHCSMSIELAGDNLWVDLQGWPNCSGRPEPGNHAPADEHQPEPEAGTDG